MTRWTPLGVPYAPAYRADYGATWTDITADPQGQTCRIVWNANTDLSYTVWRDGVVLATVSTMRKALAFVAAGGEA
jgi:hypothetical protein